MKIEIIDDVNVENREKISLKKYCLKEMKDIADINYFIKSSLKDFYDFSKKIVIEKYVKLIDQSPYVTLWGSVGNIPFRFTIGNTYVEDSPLFCLEIGYIEA